jgi:hypothetical protein
MSYDKIRLLMPLFNKIIQKVVLNYGNFKVKCLNVRLSCRRANIMGQSTTVTWQK